MGNELYDGPSYGRENVQKYARILVILGAVIFVGLIIGISSSLASRNSTPGTQQARGTLYDITDEQVAQAQAAAEQAADAWLAVSFPADAAAFEKARTGYVALTEEGSPAAAFYGKLAFPSDRAGIVPKRGEFSWTYYPFRTDSSCEASVRYSYARADGTGGQGTYSVTLKPVAEDDGIRWLVAQDTNAR